MGRLHMVHMYAFQFAIVNHFFVDGAVHICQTMGVCDARRWEVERVVGEFNLILF